MLKVSLAVPVAGGLILQLLCCQGRKKLQEEPLKKKQRTSRTDMTLPAVVLVKLAD